MLEQIFSKILDMSTTASIVFVMVFLSRIFLKKYPKIISYALWSAVFLSLILPFSIPLPEGILPVWGAESVVDNPEESNLLPKNINPVNADEFFLDGFWTDDGNGNFDADLYAGDRTNSDKENADNIKIGIINTDVINELDSDKNNVANGIKADAGKRNSGITSDNKTGSKNAANKNARKRISAWRMNFLLYGKYIWLSGTLLILSYMLVSFIKLKHKIRIAVPHRDNILIMDQNISPFVMGIVKPKIYLPQGLSESEQDYIILHEQVHIRRFDYLIKIIAFLALAIHWFNPFAWIAFSFLSKDMEMSCDETVIRMLGENTRADYAQCLLILSGGRGVMNRVPLAFGKEDIVGRIKNLKDNKTKKGIILAISVTLALILTCFLLSHMRIRATDGKAKTDGIESGEETSEILDTKDENTVDITVPEDREKAPLDLDIDLSRLYLTATGFQNNFYMIDENHVLWGSGYNKYGQLGQGMQDEEFHSEPLKIAENVIHVDFSMTGFFTIFLTEDNKLYGMGYAGKGALQQYDDFDWVRCSNVQNYCISKPCLLLEDVVYACCGENDVVCLKKDGTVWTWGTAYINGGYFSDDMSFRAKPEKILEDAVYVTGNAYHHAALKKDGTLWTWGYNIAGNCGVDDRLGIDLPIKIAEDVTFVWTSRHKTNLPWKNIDEIRYAIWAGEICNTIIRKSDGTLWVCGENVGNEERRFLEPMGKFDKMNAIWTSDFYPYEDYPVIRMKEEEFFYAIDEEQVLKNNGNEKEPGILLFTTDFVNLQEETFTNIMGFDYYTVEPAKEVAPHFYRWRIYTESEGKEINLGEAFGYSDYSDYSDSHLVNLVDIDQDGLTELICNCVYGDGALRVIVFRNNNGVIEEGFVDEEKLIRDYGIDIWGVFSLEEQYIPDKREFSIVNHTGEGKDITLTFTDLDCFYFEPYQFLE